MKLVKCKWCGHRNHPVKGRLNPAFKLKNSLHKTIVCRGCRKLMTLIFIVDHWELFESISHPTLPPLNK